MKKRNMWEIGKIDPKKNLPAFLAELAGKILHHYDGETHGCLAPHEVAVTIEENPRLFYGVPKWLIIWEAA